ncbi:MAG: hypothetical protein K2J00_07790 [Bacteroidaceae bacterium]|nr:hypothetical protein [Bacteroidaceae bacterium]
MMNKPFYIPGGKFAGEDAAARKRRELRESIFEGKPVQVTSKGGAMDNEGATVYIPFGKFAGEDAVARMKAKRRKELADALRGAKTVMLSKGGDAMEQDPNAVKIAAPKGVLATQWYDANPMLLTKEKVAMAKCFPQFTLDKLDDGRLCWVGVLEPGIYESKFGEKRQYYVMAVYDNNHPNQRMGSSVRVYPLMPDVEELVKSCGFLPSHLLRDEVGNLYLCTNEHSLIHN